MKWNLFIALILALSSFACDKQDISEIQAAEFIKYYKNYPEFTAADVTQTGSGYALLGTAKTYNSGTQICLIRTDDYGNSIDSARYYGRSLDDQAYCLQVMDDGGFAILGSSKNPATTNFEVFFIRTDSEGDTLWSRTIGESGNVEAKHCERDSQGSFFMAGYVETIDKSKEVWLFALDKDGNNLWPGTKKYGGEKNDEGHHLQILQNGDLVITGRTNSKPNGTLFYHAFILKTNKDGGLNDFNPITSLNDEEGSCIRALDNSNFLILGTSKGTAGSDISLKGVSSDGLVTEWEKTFSGSGNDIGHSMLADGNSIHILGTMGTTGTYTAISLITTDASGNQTQRSDYGLGSQLSASAFEHTSDGGFIILGTNNYSENNISVALIKIGPDSVF